LLFPHYTEQTYFTEEEITSKINLLKRNLKTLLLSLNNGMEKKYEIISDKYFEKLPTINKSLWEDAEAIYSGDPAAESVDEVILAYPGFLAIAIYRFAHELYELKVPILPRVFTEYAHQITGIDIHPGAKIGHSFFIDHGTGIVIGETSQIGNNVKIYQGVTLGALSVQKKLAKIKRHPTIEDDVIIYSNAVILGGDTVIGKGSVIGGNTWITKSLPPNSVVYNKNEIAFKNEKYTNEYLDFCI
jgi:serine O-acetyltransferase